MGMAQLLVHPLHGEGLGLHVASFELDQDSGVLLLLLEGGGALAVLVSYVEKPAATVQEDLLGLGRPVLQGCVEAEAVCLGKGDDPGMTDLGIGGMRDDSTLVVALRRVRDDLVDVELALDTKAIAVRAGTIWGCRRTDTSCAR